MKAVRTFEERKSKTSNKKLMRGTRKAEKKHRKTRKERTKQGEEKKTKKKERKKKKPDQRIAFQVSTKHLTRMLQTPGGVGGNLAKDNAVPLRPNNPPDSGKKSQESKSLVVVRYNDQS